jgi:RNA polymerase sigma-70 factor (ECF subfamily)
MVSHDQRPLLKALRRQDPRALEAAIEQYGGYVMAVALRTLGGSGSRQDAEEIVSDVFVALWKHAVRLEPDSNLKPWLAVVARNTSLKFLRSFKPTQSLDERMLEEAGEAAAAALVEEAAGAKDAGAWNAQEGLGDSLQGQALGSALKGLSATDRELLRRRYGDEQSVDAIAQETGLSQPAVKSRLYRSRKALRSQLP